MLSVPSASYVPTVNIEVRQLSVCGNRLSAVLLFGPNKQKSKKNLVLPGKFPSFGLWDITHRQWFKRFTVLLLFMDLSVTEANLNNASVH